MRVLDLFSGIGGLTLAVESLLGCPTAWFCERDPYAAKILARHWPGVPIIPDVHTVGDVGADVVCGGFPCQPHSLAGKRGASDDKRDLWPEVVRIVEANRPRLVMLENVPGLLTSEDGQFWHGMMRDLDRIGYAARWDMCEVAAVGGPHRRDRVYIVAVPVDGFTPPGPTQARPVSMFGHLTDTRTGELRAVADEPAWPTPTAKDADQSGPSRARRAEGVADTLTAAARTAWPTPTAKDADQSGPPAPKPKRTRKKATPCPQP